MVSFKRAHFLTPNILFSNPEQMKMPLPPGFTEAPKEPIVTQEPPKPSVGMIVQTASVPIPLTITETKKILNTMLMAEHRDDPNVLNFIAKYMMCRDAKQAAIECGLTAQDGKNLKRRPDIHMAIVELTDKAMQKFNYDAHEVVERVKDIVFLDPLEFENPDGSFKKLKEMSPEARRAIRKFKVKNIFGDDPNGMKVMNGEIIEIELWDKMKGIDLLGREKDLFKETRKIQHDITKNMSDTLLESKRMADDRSSKMQDVIEATAFSYKPKGE